MRNKEKNEMLFIMSILKSPEIEYNANNLAKHLGLSAMGVLKIARRMVKQNILVSRQVGKAIIYKINLKNEYTQHYINFLLKKEVEQTLPYVKVWINEIKKIKNSDLAILFGSVLKKQKEAKDIDVLFVTENKKFQMLKKEIEEINKLNPKKIHPIYQSKEDLEKNIKKHDNVILNSIKGIVVFGEDIFIEILAK